MKNIFRNALLLTLVLLLSGCLRMATYPTVDLSRFTPEPEDIARLEAAGPETLISPSELDAATQSILRDYPLWIGSSWVYDYLGYDQAREVRWRVVETVVNTRVVEGYYTVEVARTAELQEGAPEVGFPSAPEAGTFWYLLAEDHLYRLDALDALDLDRAWLELVLPLPAAGEVWYPDPALRGLAEPAAYGSRSASELFQKALPMGGTYSCANIATREENGITEGTFCEGVGFVYLEFNHDEQAFGYRSELVGFLLQ